ncbi:hypothetical protein CIPAW_06G027600 [Carya illinoinensis]|uniref:Uncharacterized protein n=1 Tax=Carya illinoinensis TaxID=32201 RepID=A0A8T1Q759_CARIL|nr:hypothetical protein CIPAW_06G027600 [Carya illinoinensis]
MSRTFNIVYTWRRMRAPRAGKRGKNCEAAAKEQYNPSGKYVCRAVLLLPHQPRTPPVSMHTGQCEYSLAKWFAMIFTEKPCSAHKIFSNQIVIIKRVQKPNSKKRS